ncbi:ribonuclease HI [Planctomycetota bacterium]
MMDVTIYTDGGSHGNPGPGGYGVVMICGQRRKELYGAYQLTTNNRMELLGSITALEALTEPCQVKLHTDSQYVVNGIAKGWAKGWRARGWRKADKKPAINPDLWGRLLDLCTEHEVKFVWVRGHAGNKENECCDALVQKAIAEGPLLEDTNYGVTV